VPTSTLALSKDLGETALSRAATVGCLPCITYLLQGGAEVNTHNDAYMTPFLLSLGCGHIDITMAIFKQNKTTPFELDEGLHLAAMHCDVDMVSHLLASGANADGRLCRQRCAAIVMASVCKTPNAVELVILLHQGGASLEHKDFAGYTAFLRAAEWGNIETADYLLVEGADTTATVNVEGHATFPLGIDHT